MRRSPAAVALFSLLVALLMLSLPSAATPPLAVITAPSESIPSSAPSALPSSAPATGSSVPPVPSSVPSAAPSSTPSAVPTRKPRPAKTPKAEVSPSAAPSRVTPAPAPRPLPRPQVVREPIFGRPELQAEIDTKLKRLYELLDREKLAGIFLTRAPDIAWITAGQVDARTDDGLDSKPLTLLIMRDGSRHVIGNFDEMQRIIFDNLNGLGYEAHPTHWFNDERAQFILDVARRQALGCDAAIEGARLLDLRPLRVPLTDTELEKYRYVGRAAADATENACRRIVPGTTERDVAADVLNGLARSGLEPTHVSVLFDERARLGGLRVPTTARFKRFATVMVGARHWGLCVDLTREVALGALSPAEMQAVTHAAAINANLEGLPRPGFNSGEIFDRLATLYVDNGAGGEWEISDQGGAIGYADPDWTLSPQHRNVFNDRQAYAWHPSVQGLRMEDTVVLFSDHVENLTQTPVWPRLSNLVGAQTMQSADVLVLSPKSERASESPRL